MLVSPSDIRKERQICINTIVEWNSINAEALNTIFNVIGWDINAHPATGTHPQEILNKQLLEKADILIGIFWTRIGTPTKEYSSGSTEEIMKHIKSRKPALIYFSSVPIIPGSVDTEQFEKLMDFKNSIRNQSFYKEYSNINEFQRMIFKDIQSLVNSELKLREESINNSTITLTPSEEIIKTLNKIARSLLQEIAQGGSGTIMIAKTLGVLHFQTDFNGYAINYNDGRQVAEFNDAIDQMETLGLIRDTGYKHEVFQITSLGYKIADLLKKQG
jgi:predicted transcriptional regulator